MNNSEVIQRNLHNSESIDKMKYLDSYAIDHYLYTVLFISVDIL